MIDVINFKLRLINFAYFFETPGTLYTLADRGPKLDLSLCKKVRFIKYDKISKTNFQTFYFSICVHNIIADAKNKLLIRT